MSPTIIIKGGTFTYKTAHSLRCAYGNRLVSQHEITSVPPRRLDAQSVRVGFRTYRRACESMAREPRPHLGEPTK